MKDHVADSADSPVNGYDGISGSTGSPSNDHDVIVPPLPPEFGPAAARSMLRLLVSIHRKQKSVEETVSKCVEEE
ncbi:hypothetical protein [Actinoplanes utahensis]|uniref:hypothetical protein n=1 Tax=Actinoplanes utahensis TaxID=1869 RepID=UPI00126A410C|nr:hypothetical protein [Actinoplanes utahensis]